jgi:hypothetical protein
MRASNGWSERDSDAGADRAASAAERALARAAARRLRREARLARRRKMTEAAHAGIAHASEAGAYFTHLLAVQRDRAALGVRRKITQAVLGVAGACAALTLLIASTLLVVRGVVQGLTVLFGDRTWLGNLAAGLFFLLAIGGAAWFFEARRNRAQLAKQVKKYEQLRNEHRARHGRHVADSAQAHAGNAPGSRGSVGAPGHSNVFE